MDGKRFDEVTMALAAGPASRRGALRLLGAALGGLLAYRSLAGSVAQETARHEGCRHAGKPCDRRGQCCSKICRRGTCRCDDGRKPCGGACCLAGQRCSDKVCVAACPAEGGGSCAAGFLPCGADDDGTCYCSPTTSGTAVCRSRAMSCSPDGSCSGCPDGTHCLQDSTCDAPCGALCLTPCGATPPSPGMAGTVSLPSDGVGP